MTQTEDYYDLITVTCVRKHLKHHIDELKTAPDIYKVLARIDAIKTLTTLLDVLSDMNP